MFKFIQFLRCFKYNFLARPRAFLSHILPQIANFSHSNIVSIWAAYLYKSTLLSHGLPVSSVITFQTLRVGPPNYSGICKSQIQAGLGKHSEVESSG